MQKNKIWDIYLRFFHWGLALTIVLAIISGLISDLDMHLIFVKIVMFLIIFRMFWGFVGYKTAKFSYFFPTPSKVINYLKFKKTQIGHNPIGSLSVFAMLFAVILQVVSGLFTTDDILFEAPFYQYASNYQELIQEFHTTFFMILIALIITHIGAIIFYKFKGQNLVKDIIDGGQTSQVFTIKYMHLRAFIVAFISFLIVYFIF